MIVVLDACAMIAFLRDESGAERVEKYLRDPRAQCLAHAINLCEVFYDFSRAHSRDTAVQAVHDLQADGVQCREDMDAEFWQAAAELKAAHKRISLADCFALSLAQRVGATLLTSDHHEFDVLAAQGIGQFEFIR